jgi:acyl dehydratase
VIFADIGTGDALPATRFGPLTIDDTVRWAGATEIWEKLHFDREYARTHSGQRSFIASGAHRQALLVRMLTDWIGPQGVVRSLRLRHTAPTLEGDLMCFGGRVVEVSTDPNDRWLACELEGTNQDGVRIITGRCVLAFPAASPAR